MTRPAGKSACSGTISAGPEVILDRLDHWRTRDARDGPPGPDIFRTFIEFLSNFINRKQRAKTACV